MPAAWEKRREARQREREKNKSTPAARPAASKPTRRGAAPQGTQFSTGQRDMFTSLQAKPIATPARGNVSGRGKRSSTPASTPTPTPKTGGGMPNLGSEYKSQELKAGNDAEKFRKGAGFTASGRGETRVNPLDVQQTGTNTGFKGSGFSEANAMLQRMGISGVGYGDFESTALPGGRPQPNINTNTEKVTNKSDDVVQSEANLQQNADGGIQNPTKETNIVGNGNIKVSNPLDPGSKAEYNRQFGRSDLSNMQGLRAAEASKGLLYASGKYWRANPNAGQDGQKDFVEISKDEWKSIKSSDQHAKDFASEKIEQVKGGMTLNAAPDGYENSEGSKPQFQMPNVPDYQPPSAKIDSEYALTDAPMLSKKSMNGLHNLYR